MQYSLISPLQAVYEPIEQVLINRGLYYEDIADYINVTSKFNFPPTKLKNIERAVSILIKHIADPEGRIDLIVDCDTDGYLSAALLLNYLHARWPTSVNKIRYKLHDGKVHGIEPVSLSPDVTLVLVPDAGSNQYDVHKELAEKGIDVVILDHHEAEYESPYACVVNNQLCDYPTKSLCGCAIVYKFCQYIDEVLSDKGFVDQYLDIVAVGLD